MQVVQDRVASAGADGQRDQNYWRTRVQKHAKQLNCDVNSKRFKDAMRFLWMPRLAERAASAAAAHHSSPASSLQQAAISGGGCFGFEMATANAAADRSPSSVVTTTNSSPCSSRTTSSGASTAATANDDDCWAAIQQDHDEFWSAASNLQQQLLYFPLAADLLPMQPDLSGWVQGFSEGGSSSPDTTHQQQLWSLDDIWRMH